MEGNRSRPLLLLLAVLVTVAGIGVTAFMWRLPTLEAAALLWTAVPLVVPFLVVRRRVGYPVVVVLCALVLLSWAVVGGLWLLPGALLLAVSPLVPRPPAEWWAPVPRALALAAVAAPLPLLAAFVLVPKAPPPLIVCTRERFDPPRGVDYHSLSSYPGGWWMGFDNRTSRAEYDRIADRLERDPGVTRVYRDGRTGYC